MNSDTAIAIINFYSQIDIYMLILVRVLGFFMVLPVIAGTNVPALFRIIFSVMIALIVFTSNKVTDALYYDSVIGYGILILHEFIVGYTLGFSVYALFTVVHFSGQLIDYQIGFSMVNVFDPISQLQVPLMGNLLYYMMLILLIQSGGLNSFIQSIFYSYDLMPIGEAVILANTNIFNMILQMMAKYFFIGVQIAMPIMGSILILDMAFGILVKAAPQMNIFTVGIPSKLLAGLSLLFYIMPVYYDVYNYLFNETFRNLISFLRGMTP